MSSKEGPVHHMSQRRSLVLHMSLKERQEHHMSLMRLMVHHMNLKAGNQVRMQVLLELHKSLKKKGTVLHMNCLQKMVLHRNWRCLLGLDKNLKGLIDQGYFHKSLLPVANYRSQ